MDSQFDQLVRGIADRRGLSAEAVRDLFDQGPFLSKDALEAGLVDGLAYRDEVYERVKDQVDAGAKYLSVRKYLRRLEASHEQAETVALIYGVGAVTRGKSDFDPGSGATTMGSDTVTRAFRNAVNDDEVEAILFRVDSPGGSYVASDAIWRETVRAREAGKPVIVSMGDVAGSGGYFVAMAADRIVAQPGTITGSIGVVGGKMLTSGLWEKTGISWDEVHTSAHSTMWTGTKDYSEEEWTLFQEWLDTVYEDFTDKVAEGRSLPKERVLDIARGRIWTGEDARKLGLIDELGGYKTAFETRSRNRTVAARRGTPAQGLSQGEVALGVSPGTRHCPKRRIRRRFRIRTDHARAATGGRARETPGSHPVDRGVDDAGTRAVSVAPARKDFHDVAAGL